MPTRDMGTKVKLERKSIFSLADVGKTKNMDVISITKLAFKTLSFHNNRPSKGVKINLVF